MQPIAIIGNISITIAILFAITIMCTVAENIYYAKYLTPIILFATQSFFSLFFISAITSNLAWGQTITLDILTFYIKNISILSSAIHTNKSIIYISIILILILNMGVFLGLLQRENNFFKIDISLNKKTKALIAIPSLLVLLAIVSINQIVIFKKNIHFNGEPLLVFIYGPMWADNSWNTIISQQKAGVKNMIKCETSESNKTNSTLKYIYLIVADGLTSNHMSCYGYQRKTTPFLDSLISEKNALEIKNAFSTSSTTHAGIASIMASKEWDDYQYGDFTIMESARRNGYRTYAFLTGIHKNWYGLTSIYSKYCDEIYESYNTEDGSPFDDYSTIKKMNAKPYEQKSLIYLHLLSSHHIGEVKKTNKIFSQKSSEWTNNRDISAINEYDNGVYQVDEIIKNIYSSKKKEILAGEALIILTADHGESLGELNEWGHSGNLSISKLSIPIIFIGKNLDSFSDNYFGTNLDIAPTIAAILGIKTSVCWKGKSLLSESKTRSIRLNSGSDCQYPSGQIIRNSDTILININNSKGVSEKKYRKTGKMRRWDLME